MGSTGVECQRGSRRRDWNVLLHGKELKKFRGSGPYEGRKWTLRKKGLCRGRLPLGTRVILK